MRKPATMPASSGTSPSTNTQPENSPGAGNAARGGNPGTAPRWDPVRSTEVSVPSTNPGPISTDVAQSTRVGTDSKQIGREDEPAADVRVEERPQVGRAVEVDGEQHDEERAADPSRVATPHHAPRTTARTSARSVNHSISVRWCLRAAPTALPMPPTANAPNAARTTDVWTSPVLVTADSTAAAAPQVPATVAA